MLQITKNSKFMQPRLFISKDKTELLTDSSIMVVKGKVGSGKSRLCLNFIVGLLEGDDDIGFTYDTCPDDKYVYYISTEMSNYHLQRRYLKVLESVPENRHDNFICLNTNGKTEYEKDLIEYFSKYPPYVVVLDQVADLIFDINNITESTKLVQDLHSLSKKENIGLIAVIHQNEGSSKFSKSRGHLGSNLEQKCISSLSISKQTKGYDITTTKIREGEGLKFSAVFNKHTQRLKRVKSVAKYKSQTLIDKIVFPINSKDLKFQIMDLNNCSLSTADKIIRQWRESDLITSIKEGKTNIYNKK